jgi:hypothetical protein
MTLVMVESRKAKMQDHVTAPASIPLFHHHTRKTYHGTLCFPSLPQSMDPNRFGQSDSDSPKSSLTGRSASAVAKPPGAAVRYVIVRGM